MALASLIRVSAGLALAAALTTGPASAGRQDVTEVGLRVTVSDESSRYLAGLDAGNFSVSEADAEQQVISVTPLGDVPVSYTLLLDTSYSLEERLARAQAVAIDLVRRLGAQDAASVYAFAPRGPDDLSAIGGQIVSDLAGQYLLRYVPSDPPRDGGWRRVDVRVDVPGATVRAKRGYFGPRTR